MNFKISRQPPARPIRVLTDFAHKSNRVSRFNRLSLVEPGPFLTKTRAADLKSDLFSWFCHRDNKKSGAKNDSWFGVKWRDVRDLNSRPPTWQSFIRAITQHYQSISALVRAIHDNNQRYLTLRAMCPECVLSNQKQVAFPTHCGKRLTISGLGCREAPRPLFFPAHYERFLNPRRTNWMRRAVG